MLPDGARFCPSCGVAVVPSAPEQRRVVTIVFADLANFTALAESVDPEAVKDLLDRCFAALAPVVERHGGRVDKVVGDELMATFGAPVAHEDDPARAVRAALGFPAALAAVDPDLVLRVGVNTGEVLAGAVGPGGSYTVTGDAVNTAHRLAAVARPGEVLVGEPTWAATRAVVEYDARPPFRLRGKRDEVRAWAAIAVGDPGAQAPVLRPRTAPLVGRAPELARLRGAARAAFTPPGRTGLVAVVGEAGVGKSRLAAELHAELWEELPAGLFLEGRCLPYGSSPLSPVAEVLRDAFGIEPGDPRSVVEEQVDVALEEILADREPGDRAELRGRLLVLLGVDTGAERRLDGGPGRARLVDELLGAARVVLEGLAASQPTMVVLDDLQWADALLLDALDRLALSPAPVPLLIVALGRSELVDRRLELAATWPGGRLDVAPLAAPDTRALLELLLDGPVAEPAADRLLEATGGNPFYVEELVSYLVDRGALRRGDEAWDLTGAVGLALPDTIRSVLRARLDALPPDERRFLEDAAVVGRVVHRDAVAALGGGSDDAVRALVRRGILERRPPDADGDLQFRHALTRDVVAAAVPLAERAAKHALVAAWLERRAGMDVGEEALGQIAWHYERAVALWTELRVRDPLVVDRARLALVRAGRSAARADALQAADRFFTRARAIGGEEAVDDLEVALQHGDVQLALRRLDAATASFEEVRHGGAAARPDLAAAATARLGAVRRLQGDEEGAAELLVDAVTRWRELGDRAGEAGALRIAAWADLVAGRARAALPRLLRALELEKSVGDREAVASTLQHLGWCSFLVGDPDAAREHLWGAGEEFERVGDEAGVAWCFGILGYTLALEGKLAQAREIAANLGDRAARRGDPHGAGLCATLLGLCEAECGDLDAAEAAIDTAAVRFGELADTWGAGMVALARGRLARARGDVAGARSALVDGLAAARSVGDVGTEARLAVELAAAEADGGSWDAAATTARSALDVVRAGVGDRDSEQRALVVLAGVASARGDLRAARVLLEEALAVGPSAPTTTGRVVRAELAAVLARSGAPEEALAFAEQALDGGNESLRSWVPAMRSRAAARAALGDVTGAEGDLAALASRAPGAP